MLQFCRYREIFRKEVLEQRDLGWQKGLVWLGIDGDKVMSHKA
jgi:hypothetical protein